MRSVLVTVMSIIVCVIAPPIKAQIVTRYITPDSLSVIIPGYSEVSYINTKTIAYNPPTPPTPPTPVDEDTTSEGNGVYYYGTPLPVNVLMSDGNFTTTSQGKVWTCRISIPNAKNIGLLFNQFNLTPNAEMYIYNSAGTILKGEIKKEHFTYGNSVTVSSMQGNTLVIYLIERGSTGAFQSSISISKIIAGYLDLFENEEQQSGSGMSTLSFHCSSSVNCIPHVQCYQSKMHSARAVARWFKIDGGQCSGTLINNETSNGRAYFLTAFHCVDENDNGQLEQGEIDNLQFATFQFQFWRTQCNGIINSRGIEFNGAVLRASSRASDVVLLELIEQPGIGDRVNYAGWNRTTSAPDDYLSYIIHHPHGADMRLTTTRRVRTHPFAWNYWQTNYSSGVVTAGSSGSALFNQNGQIVGQLKGGASCCNYTDFSDRFGKFDRSWGGAGLQTWLSPAQNNQTAPTLVLFPLEIQGSETVSCTNPSQFSVPAGLEGCTYQWTVSSNLQIVSGQNTASINVVGIANSNYNYAGTITCTLSTPGKGRIRVLTVNKAVTLSIGSINGYYTTGNTTSQHPLQVDYNGDNPVDPGYSYVTITSPEITTQTWTLQSGNPTSWQFNTQTNKLEMLLPIDGWALFRLNSPTTCGNAQFEFLFIAGGSYYMMSPNPASSNITISVDDDKLSKQKIAKSTDQDIREVIISDKTGTIKQKNVYGQNTRQVNLNVSTLKPDLYFVRIFNGKTWATLRFIKQ